MNVKTILVCISAFLSAYTLVLAKRRLKGPDEKGIRNIRMAMSWVEAVNTNLTKLAYEKAKADWIFSVNVTSENLEKADKASDTFEDFLILIHNQSKNFYWTSFESQNKTLYRLFKLIDAGITKTDNYFRGCAHICAKNQSSKIGIICCNQNMCPYKDSTSECNIPLYPDVTKIMETSKDPEERKHYWIDYRKKTGGKDRDNYVKMIRADNRFAQKLGYRNNGEYFLAHYQDKNFKKGMIKQMKMMEPLYKHIHAFVRKRLIDFYASVNIKPEGPIPAHLLGDMFANKWTYIFSIVRPYPAGRGIPNVTDSLLRKGTKIIDMYISAEKFFTSIGLKPMTPNFWHYSVIEKPPDKDIVCEPSAHDMSDWRDFRVKICTEVDSNYLNIVYHEMGHIEYFMHYAHLPHIFRNAANPGFQEAIGDSILLSVLTPKYMKTAGLLDYKELDDNEEANINYLLYMALQFLVPTRFSFIIHHWRKKVYDGTIKEKDFNKKYWQYRLKYQGVCPPVKRTEKDFDIGSNLHIAYGFEYIRYFVSNVLKFQIYQIMCKYAGHKGPLHKCSVHNKKKAGKPLAKFLKAGISKPWQETFSEFSRKETNKVDVSAMLEYFKPLLKWLKKKNKMQYIGWKSKDPMSCPRTKKVNENQLKKVKPKQKNTKPRKSKQQQGVNSRNKKQQQMEADLKL